MAQLARGPRPRGSRPQANGHKRLSLTVDRYGHLLRETNAEAACRVDEFWRKATQGEGRAQGSGTNGVQNGSGRSDRSREPLI